MKKKTYIVEFWYPNICPYEVNASSPKEAIEIAKKAESAGGLETDDCEQLPGYGETVWEETPQVYVREDSDFNPVIKSVTPYPEEIAIALKNAVNYIEKQATLTQVADIKDILATAGISEEMQAFVKTVK